VPLHRRLHRVGADQHGGVPVAVVAVDDRPGQLGVRGRAGDGEQLAGPLLARGPELTDGAPAGSQELWERGRRGRGAAG